MATHGMKAEGEVRIGQIALQEPENKNLPQLSDWCISNIFTATCMSRQNNLILILQHQISAHSAQKILLNGSETMFCSSHLVYNVCNGMVCSLYLLHFTLVSTSVYNIQG